MEVQSEVGLDLGDEESFYCVLNQDGEAVLEGSLWTRRKEMEQFFQELPPSRVVLEVGTHSPWVQPLWPAGGTKSLGPTPGK